MIVEEGEDAVVVRRRREAGAVGGADGAAEAPVLPSPGPQAYYWV
jgi:hypothetical protein